MRPIAFVLATFVASAPAAAQGWEEYSYPDYAFSVAFPANPQVDTTTYQIADNRSVPARIYSVRQANVVFSMIVAELEGTNFEENAVVDHAIKMLSQNATVRLNIPARIYRVYGRQLTLDGADGSRSMVHSITTTDSTKSRLRHFLTRTSAIPSLTWSDFINR
jgi:hypothetical protein